MAMTEKKAGRGGRRAGSGRKAMRPEQKAVGVSVNLPPALLARLDAEVERSGKSRSRLIIEALEGYLAGP